MNESRTIKMNKKRKETTKNTSSNSCNLLYTTDGIWRKANDEQLSFGVIQAQA